jgi:hypothetical protein
MVIYVMDDIPNSMSKIIANIMFNIIVNIVNNIMDEIHAWLFTFHSHGWHSFNVYP